MDPNLFVELGMNLSSSNDCANSGKNDLKSTAFGNLVVLGKKEQHCDKYSTDLDLRPIVGLYHKSALVDLDALLQHWIAAKGKPLAQIDVLALLAYYENQTLLYGYDYLPTWKAILK